MNKVEDGKPIILFGFVPVVNHSHWYKCLFSLFTVIRFHPVLLFSSARLKTFLKLAFAYHGITSQFCWYDKQIEVLMILTVKYFQTYPFYILLSLLFSEASQMWPTEVSSVLIIALSATKVELFFCPVLLHSCLCTPGSLLIISCGLPRQLAAYISLIIFWHTLRKV